MIRVLLLSTLLCIPKLYGSYGVDAHRRSYSAVAGGTVPTGGPKPTNTTFPSNRGSSSPQQAVSFKDYRVTSYPDGDSLEKYSACVRKVLKELRSEEHDRSIPAIYRIRGPTFTKLWGAADWKEHTSRWRYIRYIVDIPASRLVKRCLPQMLVLLVWSCIASFMGKHGIMVGKVQIGLTPLSLISSFVGVLLTMRTNQGLDRLFEARTNFGYVILHTREMAQLIATSVYPRDKQLGLFAARHVSLFAFVLKAHLRGVPEGVDDIIQTMLPSKADADFISNYKYKLPAAVLMRIRCIIDHLARSSNLDPEVQGFLLDSSFKLNEALMITEKIRNTPLPEIYTSHTSRLLVFYLFWLPIALYGTFKDTIVTVLVTIAVGYAMLGMDEISHILENPFLFMPLHQLAKMSMTDSADALVYQPPASVFMDRTKSNSQSSLSFPEYW